MEVGSLVLTGWCHFGEIIGANGANPRGPTFPFPHQFFPHFNHAFSRMSSWTKTCSFTSAIHRLSTTMITKYLHISTLTWLCHDLQCNGDCNVAKPEPWLWCSASLTFTVLSTKSLSTVSCECTTYSLAPLVPTQVFQSSKTIPSLFHCSHLFLLSLVFLFRQCERWPADTQQLSRPSPSLHIPPCLQNIANVLLPAFRTTPRNVYYVPTTVLNGLLDAKRFVWPPLTKP